MSSGKSYWLLARITSVWNFSGWTVDPLLHRAAELQLEMLEQQHKCEGVEALRPLPQWTSRLSKN